MLPLRSSIGITASRSALYKASAASAAAVPRLSSTSFTFNNNRTLINANLNQKRHKMMDSQAKQANQEIAAAGLPIRVYIPPSFKSYPSFFSSPALWVRLIARRMYAFGLNTFTVGLARLTGDNFKPEFLLWKNEAVDIFIKVNKAFAKRQVESVDNCLTLWSKYPLIKRQESLPKNYEFDWKLIKLLAPPKLEVFMPYGASGRSFNYLIVVYKFNTLQGLAKYNKSTGEVTKTEETVENHLAFFVDYRTNTLRLCGSTFESGLHDPVKPNEPTSNLGTVMKIQGDIFRPNDDLLNKALTQD